MKNNNLDRRLEGYSRSAVALRTVRRGLTSRGARYSAAAAAGAALVGAGPADAALISSPNQGFAVSVLSSFTSVGLDVDGDLTPDLFVSASAFFSTFFPGYTSTISSSIFTSPGSGTFFNYAGVSGRLANIRSVSNTFNTLSASTPFLFTSNLTFTVFPAYQAPSPTFASTFSRLAAFSFTAGSNISSQPNVGWLRAVIQFGPGSTRISFPTLVYNNTPGGSIHVGDTPGVPAVPEPSTVGLMGLGLLALGARGLREKRRRSKEADKA